METTVEEMVEEINLEQMKNIYVALYKELCVCEGFEGLCE